MKRQTWARVGTIVMSVLCMCWPVTAIAASSSSANYRVDETFFGSGGSINSCSSNYCSKQTLGETGVGNPSSPNYQAHAGYETTQQPYLYFVVNAGTTDLGYLSTSNTATATGTFSIRTYQSGGYIVQTMSSPPTDGNGHYLATPSTPTAPAPGTEQFGMNLVSNTVPTTFGANPFLSPVAGSAVGGAASGYNIPNKFKYAVGDTIASSTVPGNTTGEADYTISYIFNISNATPAGQYTFHDVLVATATY